MLSDGQLPRLAGELILLDIDGTITHARSQQTSEADNVLVEVLRTAMVQTHSLDRDGATAAILRQPAPGRQDVGERLEALGGARRLYWRLLMGAWNVTSESIRTRWRCATAWPRCSLRLCSAAWARST